MFKRFYSVLFYASDLNKTLNFYKSLGFDVELLDGTVRVKLGDFRLAFIDENTAPIKNESGAKGAGVFVYIEVNNVDAYYKSLQEKGVKTSCEPTDQPWGKREFAIKDTDGYKLIFFMPIK